MPADGRSRNAEDLVFGPYVIFFWIAENDEPIHVHVAMKRPTEHATKFWLTANGGCLLAHNNSGIPQKDLRDLAKLITFNHRYICSRRKETFGETSVKFYQ